jgi:retron-type reverse transcriptase
LGAFNLKLKIELEKIFGDNSVRSESIVKSASAVSWADWQKTGLGSQALIRVFEKKAEDLKDLAVQFSRNLDLIVRNAVAMGSEERLQIAALVVTKMLHDGDIKGKSNEWVSSFPKPSPFEKFLASYIKGKFQPTQTVFLELLEIAEKTDTEANCVENLIYSASEYPRTSSSFFSVLLPHRAVKNLDVDRLFSVLDSQCKSKGIRPDLSLVGIKKLPRGWREHILEYESRSNLYLSSSFRNQLSKNPFILTETKASIAEADLAEELFSELRDKIINVSTLGECLSSEGFFQRLDKSVDWTFAGKLTSVSCHGDQGQGLYDSFKKIQRSLRSESAANVALLYLIWASHSSLSKPLYKTARSLQKFVRKASPEILRLCIRCSRGVFQRDIYGVVGNSNIPELGSSALSELVLSGQLGESTDTEMLLGILRNAGGKAQKIILSAAFSEPALGLRLLEMSDAFQTKFLLQIKRGKIPEYAASDEAFHVYSKLESAGVIIETLLSRVDKITPTVSASALLKKTITYVPEFASVVLPKREVTTLQFVEIVSNPAFGKLSEVDQVGVFELKTHRGRNAYHQASKQNEISDNLLKQLEKIGAVRPFLVSYTAPRLTKKKATLSELLSSLVLNPEHAEKMSLQYSPEQLKRALPKAIVKLEGRTRISAALELAVLADLRALPVFLQLVKKIAPPYKKKDVGRRYDNLYTNYELQKKSGGSRAISAPAPHLKQVQRALLNLLYKEEFSSAAIGFMPGKSIRDNACQHVGRDIVVNADIKDFFPSTSYKQVYALSRRLVGEGLSPLAARLFSEICCHNGHLATGAPTSPAVSNLILKSLDQTLLNISEKLEVSYSRYADDFTFSGDSAAVWMLKPLQYCLTKIGYELDPKKTNIFRRGRRQTVTGAVVNEKVSLARPLRKKLRAAVHRRTKGDQPEIHGQQLSDEALKGHIAYLNMLSPEHAKPLLAKLEALDDWKH